MRRRLAAFACAVLAPACLAAEADAAVRFVVKGAGYGHGVGMSQYGAYGFAKQGRTHEQILRHYYTGTQVSTLTQSPAVTVLLKSGTTAFSGADRIGDRPLDPAETYSVKAEGAQVILRSPTGRDMVAFDGPVRAGGPDALRVAGRAAFAVTDGSFRGELEFRPSAGRLLVINAVGLDDYVRGVWPASRRRPGRPRRSRRRPWPPAPTPSRATPGAGWASRSGATRARRSTAGWQARRRRRTRRWPPPRARS
jgi:stage II sporulation protein D